jgi:N-acetylglucosamine-6-phosphate deacetylase
LATGFLLHLLTPCTSEYVVLYSFSVASSDVATTAVQNGARLITHLFNAMPQLHHRDPSIIGLLGASPHLNSPFVMTTYLPCNLQDSPSFLESSLPLNESQNSSPRGYETPTASSEAFPTIPSRKGTLSRGAITPLNLSNKNKSRPTLHLEKGQIADMAFERPYYGLIVDGIHCHPNSVRVCISQPSILKSSHSQCNQLAYSSHPDGCILITDGKLDPYIRLEKNIYVYLAMKILDPKLQDGVHEWQGGRKFVKEGDRLCLEGTTTLAGR